MKSKMNWVLLAVMAITMSGFAANAPAAFTMRIDDNHQPAEWLRVAELFEKRGIKVSFAIIPSMLNAEQGACLRKLAARGHILMDHLSCHSMFRAIYHDRDEYRRVKKLPIVADADDKSMTIYFRPEEHRKYKSRKFKLSIKGGQVIVHDPEIAKFVFDNCQRFFRLPGDEKIYAIHDFKDGAWKLYDFWRRPIVKQAEVKQVEAEFFTDGSLQPSDDTLRELAKVSQERFAHFGLPRPNIWVKPGGWEMRVDPAAIERIYGGEFGYIGADATLGKVRNGTTKWSTGCNKMWFFDQGLQITPEMVVEDIEKQLKKGKRFVTLSHMWYGWNGVPESEWYKRTERFADLLVERKIPCCTMKEQYEQR